MHTEKKRAGADRGRRDRPEPMSAAAGLPGDYPAFLAQVKARVAAAQAKAMLAVNGELIRLYWEIGDEILRREREEGSGAKVIDRLAADLRAAFPEMRGFSRANLHYMRSFAAAWPVAGGGEIVQRPVGQLPWGQNIALLKLEDHDVRSWYASKAVENGWSRRVLEAQIASDLRGRARSGAVVPAAGRCRMGEVGTPARRGQDMEVKRWGPLTQPRCRCRYRSAPSRWSRCWSGRAP